MAETLTTMVVMAMAAATATAMSTVAAAVFKVQADSGFHSWSARWQTAALPEAGTVPRAMPPSGR